MENNFNLQDIHFDDISLFDKDWYKNVPLKSWERFRLIKTNQNWYDVYQLPGNVYAICCNGHWELNIIYLIIGRDQALLLDTGIGLGDLKSLVHSLTNLPITVLLTHSHHDHIGNAHQFDDVRCFNSKQCIETVTNGIPHELFAFEFSKGAIARKLPRKIDLNTYSIKGAKVTHTVNDGDIIDLGNRELEIVWVPGHTLDSVAVIDKKNGLLFTGDAYYPSNLYAFSIDSDTKAYAKSMRKLANKIKDMQLKWIYPGHNEIVADIAIIDKIADDLETIVSDQCHNYIVGEFGLRYYSFSDNVCIITPNYK